MEVGELLSSGFDSQPRTEDIVNLIMQIMKTEQHYVSADFHWMYYCNLYLLHF